MEITIPDEVVSDVMEARVLLSTWFKWTTQDEKYLDVQRLQYQVWEIVTSLILKKLQQNEK